MHVIPPNGFPNVPSFADLDAIAKQIENMPTFTSDDRAFLSDLPSYPSEDGTKVLTATTTSGETSLSYEEVENELPINPSEDGTKVLTATTTSGETVLSWGDISNSNYSTIEQKTGKKWIDGRDVYFCTFDFSSSPVAVVYNNWTSLGVSIPNCEILLKCDATNGVTNLSASGIEFEVKSSENYGLYAEYNQNLNLRSIKFLICEYVKTV